MRGKVMSGKRETGMRKSMAAPLRLSITAEKMIAFA